LVCTRSVKLLAVFPFPKDGEWQLAFEAAFPYVETDDQIKVAKEIKEDMEKATPMDRLVCWRCRLWKNRNGYACFFLKRLWEENKLLFWRRQQYSLSNTMKRFWSDLKNFPVKIAHMSRFVTKAEQKKIIERLALGEIDILIGTHRIIQKDIVFKNLGLDDHR